MEFNDIVGDSIDQFEPEYGEVIDTNELFDGQLIRPDETPTQLSWKLIPLFMEDIDGSTKVWQIGFDNQIQQIKLVTGLLITSDGNPGILETIYQSPNINVGSNTVQTARLMYLDKYKEGFLPVGPELPFNCNGSKPMLAKTYHHPSNPDKLTANSTRIKKYPVSVMKKLNGIRAIVRLTGNKICIFSRLNNEFPHFQHIKDEMEIFLRYLPPHCELDGELYSLDLNFSQLKSAVKTVKTMHKNYNKVKYWIFDLIESNNMVWEDRYAMLVNAYTKFLEDGNKSQWFTILQTYSAINSEDIDRYHNQFIGEGYEGLVIRRYGSVESDKRLSIYRSGRTNSLVKYKDFMDEEAVIVGYDPNLDLVNIKDIRGNKLEITMRGKQLIGKQLIGKQLTIRYNKLENNIPVNPPKNKIR